jgi:hypothetical protein
MSGSDTPGAPAGHDKFGTDDALSEYRSRAKEANDWAEASIQISADLLQFLADKHLLKEYAQWHKLHGRGPKPVSLDDDTDGF